MTTGTRLGTVTRVDGADVYVELYDVAPGFEFGPCIDAVGGLSKGDQIVAQPLARDEHEYVITGRVGGATGSYIIPIERLPVAPSGNTNPTQIVRADDARLNNARTPTAHFHGADDILGVLALNRLPLLTGQAAGSFGGAATTTIAVTFATPFANPPRVLLTPVDSTAYYSAFVQSTTATGFVARLSTNNGSTSPFGATVNWLAVAQ